MSGNSSRVLAFDFFGTLFDISSMGRRIGEIVEGVDTHSFLETWRRKQLEYSYLLTVMGEYESFLGLTERSLEYSAERHGVEIQGDRKERLMDLWTTPDIYDDVVPALRKLEGRRCAILSNGNPEMLDTGLKRSGISGYFDSVISVEESEVFKPHRNAYSLVPTRYGVRPEEVVFLSSNGWDISGASHFGFYTVWVNRENLPVEKLQFTPARIIKSLGELPALLEKLE